MTVMHDINDRVHVMKHCIASISGLQISIAKLVLPHLNILPNIILVTN